MRYHSNTLGANLQVLTGLHRLCTEPSLQNSIKGNIGILCHSASVNSNFDHCVTELMKIFGTRVTKLFGPQHGFVTDVQDNMVESRDFIHPFFNIPVHSLYSQTRIPTDQMLEGLQTIIVDLQDVGTRVYTYISTLTLLMQKVKELGIRVVVLDRPNPASGAIVEGSVLEMKFQSFVGMLPIAQRHGMTIGEIAHFASKFAAADCDLHVIPMKNWQREQFFHETALPWVNPSPNLPTSDGAVVFAGTVLFEGTNISEGRGTTRALEIVGHPKIEPFGLLSKANAMLKKFKIEGCILRPQVFVPTFNKHHNRACGGFQIHITDHRSFKSWRLGQMLCRLFYEELQEQFIWDPKDYEYAFGRLAIDLINGTESIKSWVERNGTPETLFELEKIKMAEFLEQRNSVLLY